MSVLQADWRRGARCSDTGSPAATGIGLSAFEFFPSDSDQGPQIIDGLLILARAVTGKKELTESCV